MSGRPRVGVRRTPRAGRARAARGVLVDLIAAVGQVGRDRPGHLDGAVLLLRVERPDPLGDALRGRVGAGRGQRLVRVLEALEKVVEALPAVGIDDLDGAMDDFAEGHGLGFGGHGVWFYPSLRAIARASSPLVIAERRGMSSAFARSYSSCLVAPPSASGSARSVRRRSASETGSCEADMHAMFP